MRDDRFHYGAVYSGGLSCRADHHAIWLGWGVRGRIHGFISFLWNCGNFCLWFLLSFIKRVWLFCNSDAFIKFLIKAKSKCLRILVALKKGNSILGNVMPENSLACSIISASFYQYFDCLTCCVNYIIVNVQILFKQNIDPLPVISPLAFFFAMASGRLTTACWEFLKSKWNASKIPTITLKVEIKIYNIQCKT